MQSASVYTYSSPVINTSSNALTTALPIVYGDAPGSEVFWTAYRQNGAVLAKDGSSGSFTGQSGFAIVVPEILSTGAFGTGGRDQNGSSGSLCNGGGGTGVSGSGGIARTGGAGGAGQAVFISYE